ncbi:MAG: response regulator [Desulfuromonadales bacterium]|jgi:DNA-binding NtrC family response regulator|nr:response regulator [Desulfuromonadales bacterium]
MNTHKILIADNDTAECEQIAQSFIQSGYQVETTASAADVVNRVMQKETELVLLGDEFQDHVMVTDLVRILKKCNQELNIILVADTLSPAEERCFRQEGIFYHALKPVCTEDTDEIRLAVECAFNSTLEPTAATDNNYQLH